MYKEQRARKKAGKGITKGSPCLCKLLEHIMEIGGTISFWHL
jgi:hypothetical protein